MGIFSGIASAIGKGVRSVGGVVRKIGDIGMEASRRIGEFATPLASNIAGIVGNNPLGNAIKGIGEKVGNFARTTGAGIASNISNIGQSISNMGRGTSSKPPPDIASQLG